MKWNKWSGVISLLSTHNLSQKSFTLIPFIDVHLIKAHCVSVNDTTTVYRLFLLVNSLLYIVFFPFDVSKHSNPRFLCMEQQTKKQISRVLILIYLKAYSGNIYPLFAMLRK